MKFVSRGLVAAVSCWGLLGVIGCAESNEKQANITGQADPNAPQDIDAYKAQMKTAGQAGGLPSNYPGAKRQGAQ